MLTWTKRDAPIIEHPPQGQKLTGFRDPYIIQRGGEGRPWKIAIGSGVRGQGGTILQYTSNELLQGPRTLILEYWDTHLFMQAGYLMTMQGSDLL